MSGGSKCVRNVSGRDEESARNIIMALIDSQVRGPGQGVIKSSVSRIIMREGGQFDPKCY